MAAELWDWTVRGLWVTIILSAVPLLVSFCVSACIAVVQAATQIQDQSLSLVPKTAAVLASLWVTRHWSMEALLQLFQAAFKLSW